VKIAVPQGMTASYLAYIDVMENNVKEAEKVLESSLRPFNTWLATTINNPKTLLSQRPPKLVELGIEYIDVNKVVGEFNTVSEANKPTIYLEYGRCFSRNKDVEKALDKVQTMHGNMYKFPFTGVQETVKSIVSNIDLIEELLETDYEKQLPNSMSKFIADNTYEMAKQVEFFALTVYHYIAFITAFEQWQEDIKKAL
jgi:hypothetical protein